MIFHCALFADVEIGVGFLVTDGWKREHSHFKILLQQKGQRALGGRLSGGIRVVIHDDALGEAAEQFDLLLGETCSAAGHHVADSRAGHGNGVHVALDENREVLLTNALFGAVEVIQDVAFRVDGRFGRIQILRLVVTESAAAEGHDFPGLVGNGKRDAAAKAVKELAALIARKET